MRVGELDFLVTTTILERGVTFPGVDVCVVNAHEEEFSREVLVQIAGRVGRTAECPTGEVVYFHNGKTKAMVQAVREIEDLKLDKRFLGGNTDEMFMVRRGSGASSANTLVFTRSKQKVYLRQL